MRRAHHTHAHRWCVLVVAAAVVVVVSLSLSPRTPTRLNWLQGAPLSLSLRGNRGSRRHMQSSTTGSWRRRRVGCAMVLPLLTSGTTSALKLSLSATRGAAGALRMTTGGGDFWSSLGSPKYVAAPMVEQSHKSFRLLCRRHGCDLAFTQMLHAKQFSWDNAGKFRTQVFDGDQMLEGEDPSADRPLIAQFCGNDPDTLVKAARYVHHQVEAVDLNLGCPQQIARKGNYGAFLLPDADLCERLVGALASSLDCPVTVKIRCLPSDADTLALASRLEAAGAQAITVHGRTVRAAKTDNGPANWAIIGEVKSRLRIPVIANGGVETPADAAAILAATGADGVMSSEALLEDPALFDASLPPLVGLPPAAAAQRQLALAREYLDLAALYPPAIGAGPVRAHLFKMLHRLLSAHTDVRADVANGRASPGIPGLRAVVARLAERYHYDFEAGVPLRQPEEITDAIVGPVSWYRRHRNEEAEAAAAAAAAGRGAAAAAAAMARAA